MKLQLKHLDHRIMLIDLKNDHQDSEIQMLKMLMTKIINKEVVLTAAANENMTNEPMTMQKRPARLLPSYLFKTKEKKSMVGPPSSCKDLNEMGHTLNGIYIVAKNRSSILDRSDILPLRAVFCDFQMLDVENPYLSPPVKENRIGFVGLKSAEYGIHFYVQIDNADNIPKIGVLTFDRLITNVGGGMNLETGVFTAPRAGIYTFSFSILKHPYVFDFLEVSLRLNGVRVGHSGAGSGLISAPVTLQSILRLKKGDRVDLWKSHGEIHEKCTGGYCHHFSGSLIEGDYLFE